MPGGTLTHTLRSAQRADPSERKGGLGRADSRRLAEETRVPALRELRNSGDAEDATEDARERFHVALRAAHDAGASYALLGRLVGLTRQRVARIISDC